MLAASFGPLIIQEAILTIDSVHKEGLGAGSNHREQQILEFHPQFF